MPVVLMAALLICTYEHGLRRRYVTEDDKRTRIRMSLPSVGWLEECFGSIGKSVHRNRSGVLTESTVRALALVQPNVDFLLRGGRFCLGGHMSDSDHTYS